MIFRSLRLDSLSVLYKKNAILLCSKVKYKSMSSVNILKAMRVINASQ